MIIYDRDDKLTIKIGQHTIEYDPKGEHSVEWLLEDVAKAYGDPNCWILDRSGGEGPEKSPSE